MPEAHPDVSILMPVKNTASFLIDCLESILNQTKSEWELIAIDDGSEDDSFKILSDYSRRDKRIKVFQNYGKGIITALRMAYAHSSGAFITRMDSDDRMSTNKLELMHKVLIEQGQGHLAVGLVEYFSEGVMGQGYLKYAEWLNQLTYKGANFDEIYKECSIPSPCWMVSRLDLDRCDAFKPDIYPEDYDLAFRMRKAKLKVIGVHEVLHYWRDYTTRTSRIDDHYSDNSFVVLKMKHFLEQDYQPEQGLVVWGAGTKGKALATILIEENIPFRWVCNNPNKIGQNIYGKILEDQSLLLESERCTILISFFHEEAKSFSDQVLQQNGLHQLIYLC